MPFRILSLDGGGIKGTFAASVLAELERMTARSRVGTAQPLAPLTRTAAHASTAARGLVAVAGRSRRASTAARAVLILAAAAGATAGGRRCDPIALTNPRQQQKGRSSDLATDHSLTAAARSTARTAAFCVATHTAHMAGARRQPFARRWLCQKRRRPHILAVTHALDPGPSEQRPEHSARPSGRHAVAASHAAPDRPARRPHLS